MNCPEKHGLSVQLCSRGGFSCDVCTGDVDAGSEMLSCRQCDFDVCSSCAEASKEIGRRTKLGVEIGESLVRQGKLALPHSS